MSDLKTPRLVELDKALSEAKEKLESIKQPYDFDAATRKLIDDRTDAVASGNMWDKMEKLLALKDKYPNSAGWCTINSQNLSDDLSRFIMTWESFEHASIRDDRNRYERSIKMADEVVSSAERALSEYLASTDYRMDILEAKVSDLSNPKKK